MLGTVPYTPLLLHIMRIGVRRRQAASPAHVPASAVWLATGVQAVSKRVVC